MSSAYRIYLKFNPQNMKNYRFNMWLYFNFRDKGDYLKLLDELCKSQWIGYDLISQYRLDSLRSICEYAYLNTEYYHRLFNGIGLTNFQDIKKLDDFKQIPVLTKEIIRNSLPELTAVNRKDLILYKTGGSTGIPLEFYANKEYLRKQKWASNMRAYTHGGYKPGDRMAVIWGYDNDIPKKNLKNYIRNRLTYNFREINSFKLTDETLLRFVQDLNKDKITYIKGYASSLFEVSEFILKTNFKLTTKIKAVYSEAERLDDLKRVRIEEAFKCKVFNYYGSREFGTIAVECSDHNGLHINSEQLHVELDVNKSILVTSYLNQGTPFIRYQIGDCADEIISTRCDCGRYSDRINKIIGRESDNFINCRGKIIHGEYITHLFYGSRYISQFQAIQCAPDEFSFKIITKNKSLAEKEISEIIKRMEIHFESNLKVNVEFVDTIGKTKSGKCKFTIREF
jgi:phenylacetate-CoA ligase